MAILGPEQLPVVLKMRSDVIKMEILSTFGHPHVLVELSETQLEQAIRTTGDWIAQYFPRETKYAYFYTQPLVSEYPLPADAYWIKNVVWDPATTRIGDIFGAESFLFCHGGGSILLTEEGMKPIKSSKHVCTPYGIRKFRTKHHKELQYLVRVEYSDGQFVCTPNQPLRIDSFDRTKPLENWVCAAELKNGQSLVTAKGDQSKVKKIIPIPKGPTTSIICNVGCYYACHDGAPILMR